MKRCRDDEDDDAYSSPQLKRPVVSELSGHCQMMDNGSSRKLTTSDALTYLDKVKDIFRDEKEKYDEFLKVMKDFKAQRIKTTGVIARVKELFEGHPELILGFNPFLPKGFEIALPRVDDQDQIKKPLDFEEAVLFVNKIKMRFQGQDHVYKYFLDTLSKYRKENKSIKEVHQEIGAILNDQQDLLREFVNFFPDSSSVAGSNNSGHSSSNHDSQKKDIGSHTEGKVSVDRPDSDHEKGCVMVNKEHRRNDEKETNTSEETELRENHPDDKDSDGINRFVQHEHAHTLEDSVAELFHQDVHGQMLCLREKVKERLSNSEDYQTFLKSIAQYCTENITRSQLQLQVNDLLGAYADLVEEVNEFIDRSEMTRSGPKPSSLSIREKYLSKSIQELDLSDCESCTPSYRLLPKNYPIQLASQKTKIGFEVLNDHWVSVTSGSEDYSFKHMRKNQYEESLFRCEDDRFELDMLIETVNVTAKRVEGLLDRINDNSTKTDNVVHIEDFTAIHLKCIGRLYGDHGLDVMDVLRKNASLALPVILTRLKQKQEEWLRCRADTKKAWAEIYAKNYHKSLDHRSFYFKQQDSKSLSAKALLAEIKEISENKSVEDNILQCIAPGKKQNAIPHQEFKYSDLDIHEDLYQLMSYAVSQSASSDQMDKAMRIWIAFVEPMLGVPPRVSCVSDQDATKRSSRTAISGSTAVRQSDGKLAKNGDEVFTENLGSSRASMVYINNGVKENGLSNTNEHILIPDVSIATDSHIKIERETMGELLPNGDPKKDNCAAYSDHGLESSHKSKAITLTKNIYQNKRQRGGLENEAGVNTFENADESGSESDDAADLSPEEHDNNGESEGVVDGMGDDTCPVSEHFLKRMKPLMLHVPARLHNKANKSRVFYGNDDFYVFFRLHQILYSRLVEAKEKSLVERWRGSNDTTSTDSYARFLDLLYSFLDGAIDGAKYEDECRAVLGTWSFPVFTLDKLIDKLTKLLLSITIDDVNNKLLDLFAYECLRKTERFVDELYNANASVIVNDSKIFRFECSSIPETYRQTRLTIEILNFGYDKSEPSASMMDPNFAAYLRTQLLSVNSLKRGHTIFLKRNTGKHSCDDEDLEMEKAMEGFHILNGLEFKITAFTYKVYYVMGTSDSLVRIGRKRINKRMPSHERANSSSGLSLRAMRFRKLLVSRIQPTETRQAV